jgi:hypothetical protein
MQTCLHQPAAAELLLLHHSLTPDEPSMLMRKLHRIVARMLTHLSSSIHAPLMSFAVYRC